MKSLSIAEANKRAEKLRTELDKIRYDYHVLDTESVSESVKSSLMHELSLLEDEFPELITPESPTQRIAGEPLPGFKKVVHSIPGNSLNDVFNESEISSWEKRIKSIAESDEIFEGKINYFAELKIDGLSVYLVYKDGLLQTAATRGNGKIGEDVTANIKTIEAIPLRLRLDTKELLDITNNGNIEVRGEVFMTHKELERINKQRETNGEAVYANPRNLAAGTLRQLDPKVVAGRKLEFAVWAVFDSKAKTHEEEHSLAKKLGFKVEEHSKQCKDISEVVEFIEKWDKPRHVLPYQTDGMVINVNNSKIFSRLGMVGKAPRGAVAYKYSAEQGTTKILEIRVNVGRTGAITPFAVMEPVKLAGTTVTRATLHNADEIDRKDIRLGDTVIVQKAGDIIPEVVRSLPELRDGKEKKFVMPTKCPICGGPVSKPEGEAVARCISTDCFAIEKERIIHFVSRDAFNIEGLGEKIVEQLIIEGIIADAADLFVLEKGDLEPLERFADKSASNLVASISDHKRIPLNRLIYALGIRFVGAITANDLANYFDNLDQIAKATKDELTSIEGIGEVASESIESWFKDNKNKKLIAKLIESGVDFEKKRSVSDKLKGMTFVITGSLESISRDVAEQKIRELGGKATSSVSANTSYLVIGEKPGSKLAKAEQFGVKIISESEFLALINQ
ncbi:MAG: NAD-dependent DNA ligase LigA [bacterium]